MTHFPCRIFSIFPFCFLFLLTIIIIIIIFNNCREAQTTSVTESTEELYEISGKLIDINLWKLHHSKYNFPCYPHWISWSLRPRNLLLLHKAEIGLARDSYFLIIYFTCLRNVLPFPLQKNIKRRKRKRLATVSCFIILFSLLSLTCAFRL